MIFNFKEPKEFLKFAELSDKHRYVVYKSSIHNFYMLRPIKSSKHLDTGIYNGVDNKELENVLTEKYTVLTVSEITFLRE